MNGFAKTREQMALSYGICTRTFKKWLRAENIVLRPGLISPKQQLDIRNKLGEPKIFNTNNPVKK
ncbi:MAG: hypothetical protein ABSA76_04110 [Bacteroidales bacterium]